MTDTPETTVHRGTVLAPERDAHRDTGRPIIVSAFARVRNQVLQKELASLAAKARTWNEFVMALRDGERLKLEYMAALTRSENLDQLRIAEEAKVLAEVQAIFDEAGVRQKEHKLHNLRLDAEIERAQRELDALKKPPSEGPKESRGTRRARRIKEIREERDEMIKAFTGNRPENDLTEEERGIVNDIRLAAENEIKRFLEEDRD